MKEEFGEISGLGTAPRSDFVPVSLKDRWLPLNCSEERFPVSQHVLPAQLSLFSAQVEGSLLLGSHRPSRRGHTK